MRCGGRRLRTAYARNGLESFRVKVVRAGASHNIGIVIEQHRGATSNDLGALTLRRMIATPELV
jgi:hypothetical protein